MSGDARPVMYGLPEGITPAMTMGDPPRWRRLGDSAARPPRDPSPGTPQQQERESVTLARPRREQP